MKESEKLDRAVTEIESQASKLKDFNKIYTAMASLKHDIESAASDLSAGVKELASSKKEIDAILDSFSKKVDELYSDQKKFYKELDDSLANRLDKLKSDLQVEIRNEIAQIQKVFDNSLESKLRLLDDGNKKRHTTLIIILILVTLISAAGLLLPFLKLG